MSEIPFTPPVPGNPETAPADQQYSGRANIQVLAGAPAITPGCVALVLHNIPIVPVQFPDGTELLVPCTQMRAREAMELAMNIIYVAKIAENIQEDQ